MASELFLLAGSHHGRLSSSLRKKGGWAGGGTGPKAQDWLEFLDNNKIELTVLYPTQGLTHGAIQDQDWAICMARAYNDWLYNKFMTVSPRLVGVALLPIQDIGEAVKELRRAVNELGWSAPCFRRWRRRETLQRTGVLSALGRSAETRRAGFDPRRAQHAVPRFGCGQQLYHRPYFRTSLRADSSIHRNDIRRRVRTFSPTSSSAASNAASVGCRT